MKKILLLLLLVLAIACSKNTKFPNGDSRYESFTADSVEFRVACNPWNVDMRGNHRAVIYVDDSHSDAIIVNLPWRRPDLHIDSKKIIVTDTLGNEIKDVAVTLMTSEKGQLLFKPIPEIHDYYVYYMPFRFRHHSGDARYGNPWNDYLPAVYSADNMWLTKVIKNKDNYPYASVKYIESRTRFNFWSPMGLIATSAEMDVVKSAVDKEMIIFPEDRAFPIQLTNQLPCKWNNVPDSVFTGLALRNEYYVWQLGIWAAKKSLENVKVEFSDLINGKDTILASELTCFNQEGTNWDGKHIEFSINVPNSKVQALWCGVQIPEDAKTGTYKGKIKVSAENVKSQVIDLNIKVESEVIADKGDSEPWRHGRLRWLNSTIAMDSVPTKPYLDIVLDGNHIDASGKSVIVSSNGMIESVSTHGINIFTEPQQFVVVTNRGTILFSSDNVEISKDAAGFVSWKSSSVQDGLKFDLYAEMEFDGYIHYNINVSSDENINVQDVRLITTYSAIASEYYMGCGVDGGNRPESFTWNWVGPYDSYWIGGPDAGMHTEFRGGLYHGPLINDYKPEPTPVWSNNGLGRIIVQGRRGDAAKVIASTGESVISANPRNYEFDLLITPVREIEPSKHFSEIYFHGNPANCDDAAKNGCNIFNIHHAKALNPYINYPFIVRDSLINHVKYQHQKKRKVKLYYTIRELTTHCTEVYAFHSLNHEIFAAGVGYGLPWECEHLVDDYKPAWYTSLEDLPEFEPDAALVLTANSRFINYWLEGLRWMEENYDIDGIYMDDVSFDRTTVKRIRKVLDRFHDGALIDLHSNTGYSRGPMNQYTEFLPYVDRLWFGESFRYNDMAADQWLVTFSGIPFGRMSEMLQDGGNRYLGMLFGASARNNKTSIPVWKFWKEYKIKDAKMVGWWDKNSPVSTSDIDVKATAYINDDYVIVSIGNFASQDKIIKLNVNWDLLKIDPTKIVIKAPNIEDFQSETIFAANEPIKVNSKEGYLLVITIHD